MYLFIYFTETKIEVFVLVQTKPFFIYSIIN